MIGILAPSRLSWASRRLSMKDPALACHTMTGLQFPSQEPKIIPTDKDVLSTAKFAVARRRFDNHPGNRFFNTIIDSKKETYQHPTSSRKSKTFMIDSIIELVHRSGGRFLIIDDAGDWSELSARQLTDKLSHALRRRKKSQEDAVTVAAKSASKKRKLRANDAQPNPNSIDMLRLTEDPPGPSIGVDGLDPASSPSDSDEDETVGTAFSTNLAGAATTFSSQQDVQIPQGKRDVADHQPSNSWLPLTFDVIPFGCTSMITNDYYISKNVDSKRRQKSSTSSNHLLREFNAMRGNTQTTDHELEAEWAEEVLEVLSRTE